jgi:uncharacterized protein (DUF4415 family)
MNEPATKTKHSADDPVSDELIDTSDIPEITGAQWQTAQPGRFFRPNKTSITIRLDADLVDWFKTNADRSGYQTEINRVLRQHMIAKRTG